MELMSWFANDCYTENNLPLSQWPSCLYECLFLYLFVFCGADTYMKTIAHNGKRKKEFTKNKIGWPFIVNILLWFSALLMVSLLLHCVLWYLYGWQKDHRFSYISVMQMRVHSKWQASDMTHTFKRKTLMNGVQLKRPISWKVHSHPWSQKQLSFH